MTGLAEEVVIQWVAALVGGFHRQEHAAVLTAVTVLVEIPSHALDFEGVLPVSGDDGILADAAHGGKFPRWTGSTSQESQLLTLTKESAGQRCEAAVHPAPRPRGC